ncbi:MAG TPA: cupin domain-containing protein [Gaiellaceae bacterium]|nr:cupin domain-containing protein [Gaiellaceae bacterium]
MTIFNVRTSDEWDLTEDRQGFAFKDAWVGDRIGAELIGGSLYEIAPGKKLWPYHLHHANEEWVVVIGGRPTLRTPEGERELTEGDVTCFLRGPAGAHQIINRSKEPVRVLMLSTNLAPEVLEYPDSDKIAATDAKGNRLFRSRPGEPVDYWDGEG